MVEGFEPSQTSRSCSLVPTVFAMNTRDGVTRHLLSVSARPRRRIPFSPYHIEIHLLDKLATTGRSHL